MPFPNSCFRVGVIATTLTAIGGCVGCEEPAVLAATFALCVAPEAVDFGPQTLRTEETRAVSVTNCGNVPIDGLSAVLTGPDGDETLSRTLQIVETSVPLPFMPGDRFLLPIRFRPTEARAHAAELVVAVDGVVDAQARASVAVAGEGVPPGACDVLIGPSPIDFGAVLLGDAVEREVTLTNQGTTDCALSAARVTLQQTDFFEVAVPPPTVVAPGDSVTATLRFAPTDVGARAGRFAVVVDGGAELAVDLGGTGISRDTCALTAEPAPIALPRAAIGQPGTEASTILRSVGELPCTIASVTVTAASAAGDFTLPTRPADGASLATDDTAVVTVAFTPSTPGPRNAVLVVTTAEGQRVEVPVSAFADPAPTCALLFDPGTVAFSPLGVGLSAEQTVSFRNASTVTCDLLGSSLTADSAPDFELLEVNAPSTLLPGTTGTARIRYTAPRASPSLGRLVLTLSGGVTSTVDLLGFGAFANFVLTPGFVPFGIVTSGCVSDIATFEITNIGTVTGRLDTVDFTSATDPNFTALTGVAPGTLVPPGETVSVAVRMTGALNAGSHHGRLEVRSTGTREALQSSEFTGRTESVEDAARTDSFTQRERPTIDILFVIDDSGSMSEEQSNLTLNFGEFIRFTTELDIDYHIGVTTTDTTGTTGGHLVGPFIANTGANASSDPIADFVAQARVGTSGSATEKGLEAAALAVSEPARSGQNAGFLRDGALLSVIYVSDEQDSSPGDVARYIDALLDAKGRDPDAVIASAIAGDVPGGCDSVAGAAAAGTRYLDVVNALQGVFASICAVDWATTMEDIGLSTFQALTRFRLSREPDLDTMVVTVDGVVIPEDELNGWSYDPVTNAVKFNGTSVPAAGQTIDVNYTAECLTP